LNSRNMRLTVREALQLGALTKATVLAGHAGLDREIRHVSVIEVPDAHHWFRGHELWLTAFYNLKDNPRGQVEMLEHMCRRESAALAVCYPRRYGPGPAGEVVARADELAFPLLQLADDVAYIDAIYPVYQEIVDRQARELEYALRINDEMSALILENKGLQDIAASLNQLVGNPISVHDERLGVIGLATSDADDAFGANLRSLWSATRLPVPALDDANSAEGAIRETIVALPETGEVVTVLARPIAVANTVYGWMMIWLSSLAPHPWLRVSLVRACNVAALHLIKERAVLEAERRTQRDFLDEVLLGTIKSDPVLLARGRLVGWNLASKHIVLVAECDVPAHECILLKEGQPEGRFAGRKGDLVASTVRAADQGHVVVLRGNSAIVLVDVEMGAGVESARARALGLAEKIRDAVVGMDDETVTIGVGSYQGRPSELWRSYEDARRAIDLGRRVSGPSHIWPIDDLRAFDLLETLAGTPRAADLISSALGPLQEHDRRHGTQLLQTLDTYFDCRECTRLTAERLFIHRNTLAYRLAKISEILGFDPISHPHRFLLMLALALRRLT
jgi:purine catabolism regulator